MEELCMGCMKPLGNSEVCPHCGMSRNYIQEKPFLSINTELQEKYTVGKVIKQTTDSVQYIGYDKILKSPVIIREFLPLDICERDENNKNVKEKL